MKAGNAPPVNVALPRPVSSTSTTTVQQSTGAPPAPASTPRAPAQFTSSFETSSQRSAGPVGDILPTPLSPPTNERLTKAVDDALKRVYGSNTPPSGKRSELYNLATQMRTEGKSAGAIENALVAKLHTEKAAEQDKANPAQQLDDAIKLAYRGGAQPSQADKDKWLKTAQDMAAAGKGASDIKWELYNQMKAAQSGMDNNGPAVQNKMFLEAYKQVHGHTATPSPADEAKWMKVANEMAAAGKNPSDIKWDLYAQIKAAKEGVVSNAPANTQAAVLDAFKQVNGRNASPSPAEQEKWNKVAAEMAKEGKSEYNIKWDLVAKMNEAKAGTAPTGGGSVGGEVPKKMFMEAYKQLHGHTATPSPAEEEKWMKVANEMATAGKSASDIKWDLYAQMQAARAGTSDINAPGALESIVGEAFKQVLRNNPRQPSGREVTEWVKVAERMRTEGKNASDIKWALITQMNDALSNR